MSFWPEFLLIAAVHLMAVASPGPDFAIVLRYAVRFGRKQAVYASMGIGLAILLHVTWSLVGIAVLIKTTPWLFKTLSLAAAAYLFYIGVQSLRSMAPAEAEHLSEQKAADAVPSAGKSFIAGFITNGLNPKATLFFLSLFAVIISPDTPLSYKVIYGLYMSVATAAWFCMLSVVLTHTKVRGFLLLKGYWFDRVMGVLLLALAMHLVVSSFSS
ncbi:LysE family translocator [Rheinheimera aquimaris]|jgi:threonine/homoserine/homoserine lactone efflux protein|uniref:LysE family translocator n=1 Tax=Rheinheimera aquimaris TaxID=412437 RepID=UPI000E9500F5|nr:LysE family translocator [Rheinheimera aquimaris]MCD1599427.1 LysE family translocator [Rheinheimera aquimaris]HBN88332.1 lysine transporter LysE [Rheinheimera sp.]|tara:strand:- start:137 stop:778 length:642 start_codon:yes stop_codon:yes gene_type:complete